MKKFIIPLGVIIIFIFSGIPIITIANGTIQTNIVDIGYDIEQIIDDEYTFFGNSLGKFDFYFIYGKINNPEFYEYNGDEHLCFNAESVKIIGYHLNGGWSHTADPFIKHINSTNFDLFLDHGGSYPGKFRGIVSNNFIVAIRNERSSLFPFLSIFLMPFICIIIHK